MRSGLNRVVWIFAAASVAVLTACGGGANGSGTADAEACAAVTPDLQTAREAVIEAIGYGDWSQVMLAPDVTGPTQKYGLLVMPFVATDAVSRVTGTVALEGENYVIEATDAAGEVVCQIDQDGTITRVDK